MKLIGVSSTSKLSKLFQALKTIWWWGPFALLISLLLSSTVPGVLAWEPDNPDGERAFLTPASQIQASNVQLVAHIGGITLDVAVGGSYLYAGEGPSLNILNISFPHQDTPQLVSRIGPLSSGIVQSVAVSGTHAYVTAGSCLWIIDASTPTSPTVASSYCPSWFSGTMNEVAVAGDYAYIAASDYGLMIVNVSDPQHPAEASTFSTYVAEGVAVSGNYAYIADGTNGLRIVDVSNPSSPSEAGSYAPSGFWANRVTVEGSYAYVAAGYNTGDPVTAWDGLAVIDVSDPSNPDHVGTYEMYDQPAYPYDVVVDSGFAYMVDYNLSRLYIVSVATPTNPYEVGYYHTPGWAQGVAVAKGYAYVADKTRGVRVVEVSDPYTPTEAGSYETLGDPQAVAVYWDQAYVADAAYGLRILDVRTPENPVVEGSFATRAAKNVAVASGYVYVVNDPCTDRCFQILNVAYPSSPSEVGWYDTGWSNDVAVSGDYAYVVGVNGLSIVDISNPAAPSFAGSYDPGTCYAVALGGNYAYVTEWSGLRIVDVSNPSSPSEVASWNSSVPAMDVTLDPSLAYIAAGGLHIVRPELSGPYEEGAYAPGTGEDYQSVALEGFYAYVADWNKGLRIIDVSDSSSPYEVGYYDPPGGVGRGVAVHLGYVYLANDEYGLFILQFAPSVSATIPTSGGTLTSTPDQTTYSFPAGTFSASVIVTHTMRLAGVPSFGNLTGIHHTFELNAVYSDTGQPAQPAPGRTYTVTVTYSDGEKGAAIEDTLALYYWDGGQWVKEPSSQVDTVHNTVTATPNHMSLWAVLGESKRVFLPLVLKSR